MTLASFSSTPVAQTAITKDETMSQIWRSFRGRHRAACLTRCKIRVRGASVRIARG